MDFHGRKCLVDARGPQEAVAKGQAAGLAPQGPLAHPRQPHAGVEIATVELGDYGAVALFARVADGLAGEAPQGIDILEIPHALGTQTRSQLEFRARLEPQREVIATSMVDQAGFGHIQNALGQLAQVAGLGDHRAIGHAESEIPEAKAPGQDFAQVAEQGGRPLEQERGSNLRRQGTVLGHARLHHDADVAAPFENLAAEGQAGMLVQLALAWKLKIRDDPQGLTLVANEVIPSILVVLREQDLGSRPHAHHLLREREVLGQER